MEMCEQQIYFARNFRNSSSYNQTIERTDMKRELKRLQKELEKELLTDEKFIEAALQAIKDLKTETQRPNQIALG